jgi:hypothetical protein
VVRQDLEDRRKTLEERRWLGAWVEEDGAVGVEVAKEKLMDLDAPRRTVLETAMKRDNPEGREWLFAGEALPYGDQLGKVVFYALEGTPCRGYIIFRVSDGTAWRYDGEGKRISTVDFDWED